MIAWPPMLGQAGAESTGLTTAGTIVMVASIGLVLALAGFCMVRLLGESKPEQHHHAPLDIDTEDLDT